MKEIILTRYRHSNYFASTSGRGFRFSATVAADLREPSDDIP